MTDEDVAREFMSELLREFPDFRILSKTNSTLSKSIDLALKLATFGQMRQFMTDYHTVIGYTLYVPPMWDEADPIDQVITLRHERVHLRQRRRYTMLGMAFLYLLPFFPLGLAYGRARLEWEAYAETLRATAELRGIDAAMSPLLRRRVIDQFASPSYGWMWPFRGMVERWYDDVLARLNER